MFSIIVDLIDTGLNTDHDEHLLYNKKTIDDSLCEIYLCMES